MRLNIPHVENLIAPIARPQTWAFLGAPPVAVILGLLLGIAIFMI